MQYFYFRNLKETNPNDEREDTLLLRTISRANLNVFWSREPGTVSATKIDSAKLVKIGKSKGLKI